MSSWQTRIDKLEKQLNSSGSDLDKSFESDSQAVYRTTMDFASMRRPTTLMGNENTSSNRNRIKRITDVRSYNLGQSDDPNATMNGSNHFLCLSRSGAGLIIGKEKTFENDDIATSSLIQVIGKAVALNNQSKGAMESIADFTKRRQFRKIESIIDRVSDATKESGSISRDTSLCTECEESFDVSLTDEKNGTEDSDNVVPKMENLSLSLDETVDTTEKTLRLSKIPTKNVRNGELVKHREYREVNEFGRSPVSSKSLENCGQDITFTSEAGTFCDKNEASPIRENSANSLLQHFHYNDDKVKALRREYVNDIRERINAIEKLLS